MASGPQWSKHFISLLCSCFFCVHREAGYARSGAVSVVHCCFPALSTISGAEKILALNSSSAPSHVPSHLLSFSWLMLYKHVGLLSDLGEMPHWVVWALAS